MASRPGLENTRSKNNCTDIFPLKENLKTEILTAVKFFDERFWATEDIMKETFRHFASSTSYSNIFAKVTALNAFYGTNIYDRERISIHIAEIKDFDAEVKAGCTQLIDKIAKGHGIPFTGKEHSLYSFATKYCHWHAPEHYPVFDSFVDKMLAKFMKREDFRSLFTGEEKWPSSKFDFESFKRLIEKFREPTHDKATFFKAFDKFLWLYGRKIFSNRSILCVKNIDKDRLSVVVKDTKNKDDTIKTIEVCVDEKIRREVFKYNRFDSVTECYGNITWRGEHLVELSTSAVIKAGNENSRDEAIKAEKRWFRVIPPRPQSC